MILKLVTTNAQAPSFTLSIRCPACKQRGTFEAVGIQDLHNATNELRQIITNGQPINYGVNHTFGQRRCPNPECRAHIFFITESSERVLLLATYPAERIDFDATNIPPQVLAALEEAITCHANKCYIASAIMVRKTLEALCKDKGATGANLKERLIALSSRVVLPQELLNGLHDLRLLGNDAAHIESQSYDQVGQEEVELSVEIAKEVLKGVYQYSDLISRLQSLKK